MSTSTSTSTSSTSVRTFVTAQTSLLSAIDREESAAVRVLAALQTLAVAASLAVRDGASLAVLQSANVAALTAQGWTIERTGDQDGASRTARGMADAMFVSKAALAYLAFTGDLYGLPVADGAGNVPDSKAVLSLVRRVYKGSKADGLGAAAVKRALATGSQQGAVSSLQAALKAAQGKAADRAQSEQDAANDGAQATAPVTLADVIRGAVSMVGAGAPITPDVLAALAELSGAVRDASKGERRPVAAVPGTVAAA